jgi:hypothetical protein
MAYCSQCGVELEESISECPLCNYKVPEDLVKSDTQNFSAFPEAINAYERQQYVTRNKILYTYSMIVIAGALIALTLNFITDSSTDLFKYIMVCLITSVIILFLLLGYIKKIERIIVGLGITALVMSLVLDGINGKLLWSVYYALPMIFYSTLVAFFVAKKYSKSAYTNHFIFIPVYICIALAMILPVIELVIALNIRHRFYMSWSIISTISLLAFSGIVAGLYYKMPAYIKERLLRLFHV